LQAIGILGGTFDPIHFGHLRMAQELHDALELATIRFVPAARPPLRAAPQTSAAQRAEMVRLAIAGNAAFGLDLRELARTGPSYTFDTLSELRAELGSATPLALLLGGDAFLGLPGWHRWQELPQLAHLVVAHRPGAVPDATRMPPELQALWQQRASAHPADLHRSPAGKIFLQRITALDISASHIRRTLQQGRSARYLLPDAVGDYIAAHRLYPPT
jgi:nicotinate-nucleotide adenylyltransferase